MNVKLFFLLLILIITGCTENPKQNFYNLINENFFMIADSTAYRTGRLIQIPSDALDDHSFNKVCILVDTAFNNPAGLSKYLLISIQEENLKEFEEIVLCVNDLEFDTIDISQCTKTGKFTLITSKMAPGMLCSAIAGKVTFFKPYINKNKAIIIFSISESSKSGYTNSLLFRKENGKWKFIKRIDIERW